MYELKIVVDTNDADYQTNIKKVSQEELDKVIPLLVAIKSHIGGYSLPVAEYDYSELFSRYPEWTDEIKDLLEDLIPTDDNGYCHTLVSACYYPTPEKIKIV